jgi:hypothetical protein
LRQRRRLPSDSLLLCALGALAFSACRSDGQAVLVLVVTASGSPPPATALTVTITNASGPSSQVYDNGGAPLAFPTTLSAELPASAAGEVSVDVLARDGSGNDVASGRIAALTLAAGQSTTAYLSLSCGSADCLVDGGTGVPDGGGPMSSPRCGNGRIDPGESCDTAVAPGNPGACPPANCDDGVACTTDVAQGSGCTLVCRHVAITRVTPGTPKDGCCPPGATFATDPDCSPTCGDGVIQSGETCDTGIPAGQPGACPTPGACSVSDPCVFTLLVSTGTCQAICMHYQVNQPSSGDGCCPPGATNAVDGDCPALCGDGVRQVQSGSVETCDVGIPPPAPGSCPTTCDDGNPCTTDFLVGSGCQATCVHDLIKSAISGDGCCPTGATRATDSDCAATCGDGIVEPGETCDTQAAGPGACPSPNGCPPSPSVCLQEVFTGRACSAACTLTPITSCGPVSDGCCPAGCTALDDPDCSPTCGNGAVQPGEACDTAIPAGTPGACPTSCDDGDPCTTDLLVSAGTCAANCQHLAVTAFVAGDGCCPPGGTLAVDADCAAVCGNGVVEPPVETCDDAVDGSCPTTGTCPATGSCATSSVRGDPATCSAACVVTPITACVGGDSCCPLGCTAASDPDCSPICGDGVVEAGEQCDRAITAGFPGACADTCDDGDACTGDIASGSSSDCSRHCTHTAIVACLSGDGCCPSGCTPATDTDCQATCGDKKVEAGETCDPPSTCPTTCPDDGDPCTTEVLVGDPADCNAACRHVPIASCSGRTLDRCCPTGCTAATDGDC